jgi:hypothetical protein
MNGANVNNGSSIREAKVLYTGESFVRGDATAEGSLSRLLLRFVEHGCGQLEQRATRREAGYFEVDSRASLFHLIRFRSIATIVPVQCSPDPTQTKGS